MKTYYITSQLVYMTVEETENGNHSVEDKNGDYISFKAHVYTNALNNDPKAGYLVGVKVKDNVLVRIPANTPSITY